MLVAVQLFVDGLYLPPVFTKGNPPPPQTIISLPVQTAVCKLRAEGALLVLVAIQLSVAGLYVPPVFKVVKVGKRELPPQTIISLPVQTAVCPLRPVGALLVVESSQLALAGFHAPPVF